ncbi:MAG TPA: hypothetical protein VJ808_10715, partial [Gemmatimonadales bacterium]|nr:hypothetical protein [Gemmatimonadales bacterium]
MTGLSPLACRSAALRLFAGALLLAGGTACGGEAVAPSSEAALPADSLAAAPVDTSAVPAPPDSLTTPTDSTAGPPVDSTGTPPVDSIGMPSSGAALLDTRSRSPGIVFASDGMRTNLINSVHTGSKLGGAIGPSNVLSVLADARARGGRVIVKLCMGSDSYVKNSDGTFSFTKWKALVDRFRNINIGPYIA